MKLGKLGAAFLGVITICSLTGCNSTGSQNIKGKIPATFHLEGGMCQNSIYDVVYYYDFGDKTEMKIGDPNVIETREDYHITRKGYDLDGWYLTKTGEGDDATYSDQWDFSKNTMTKEGVHLYAKWVKQIKYSFELYYKDENNKDVLIKSYGANQNATFGSVYIDRAAAKAYPGHTFINFSDVNGNVIDDIYTIYTSTDESNPVVKLYANYIEGDFTIVSTASEFLSAIRTGKSVYLMNDIDLEGKDLFVERYNNATLNGNGHTVSNFNLSFNKSKTGDLYVGIFGAMRNSNVIDTKFTGAKFNFEYNGTRIQAAYLGAVAGTATGGKIENVTFEGEYTIASSDKMTIDYIDYINDGRVYYSLLKDDELGDTVVTNSTSTITIIDNRQSNDVK